MTNVATYVVIGSIVTVALILGLIGWRVIVEFRKGASHREDDD